MSQCVAPFQLRIFYDSTIHLSIFSASWANKYGQEIKARLFTSILTIPANVFSTSTGFLKFFPTGDSVAWCRYSLRGWEKWVASDFVCRACRKHQMCWQGLKKIPFLQRAMAPLWSFCVLLTGYSLLLYSSKIEPISQQAEEKHTDE